VSNEQLQTKVQTERDNALAELKDVIDHARYKSLGDGRDGYETQSPNVSG